jgi:ElaB/YqjD/DUF883 family membrane-anchored ribosome-binding protein
MYKRLDDNVIALENKVEEMFKELNKALYKSNKAAMRRFRKLSNEVTKSLKEFRQETVRIEKESK